jgi:hypothetical protein
LDKVKKSHGYQFSETELCVLLNYEMSCSEYIQTKPAILKAAQGTEKYDFKNKMKQELTKCSWDKVIGVCHEH